VDARKLYRDQGFSSMFDYCVRSLHMSESEADLRIKAARIGREYPSALEMLARGELHMTALRVLAPVLTASNTHLLKEACFKSKLEVKELIAKHFPSPDVADSMRRLPQPRSNPIAHAPEPAVPPQLNLTGPLPLAPQLASAQHRQSIQTCGVPQLASAHQHQSIQTSGAPLLASAQHRQSIQTCGVPQLASPHQHQSVQACGTPSLAAVPSRRTDSRPGASVPLSEGRYSVRFTASKSLHDMLKEARDLCCDQIPNGDLASIVEQALVLLIAQKKKQRFALTSLPRKQWLPRSGANSSSNKSDKVCVTKSPAEGTLNRPRDAERALANRAPNKPDDRSLEAARSLPTRDESEPDSRYIPSALRREVCLRDGGQCTFVSKTGTRCGSRRDLEFDHIVPFARGGAMTRDNLRLMCRAHNALLAEREYGRGYVKSRIAKQLDRPVSHQTTAPGPDRTQR
jgi:5-methylcytosine-specific restriction endonuclease McrA